MAEWTAVADDVRFRVSVPAPAAREVVVVVGGRRLAASPGDGRWTVEVTAPAGTHYWICVDGGPPLLDPGCRDVELTPDGPRSVVRSLWPTHDRGAPLERDPVVYELHVRGFGRTFHGCIEHLDHVVAAGANVVEVMPVHPFDDRHNYWGYMPLVWGAVHRNFSSQPDRAAEEFAEFVAAAHVRGLHVWLDVVFNHTGEGDRSKPTLSLRGLDDRACYRHRPDGEYTNDSGCGNDIDPSNPYVRHLVLEALDRFARLGVDGFRFDLASLLARDGGELVRMITEWAEWRGVTLVAEPWDLANYQVGHPTWDPPWLQWNDRFRDDVRGFLRGEPGLVWDVHQRVQGSPDLMGPSASLNFLTAHDGLTLHDVTMVTSDRHRSWDCGPEMRMQQLKNHFAMLLLSAGTPMWVMGDEFARTQQGHDNPYDVDGPLTWVDWSRADEWRELTAWVRQLVDLRAAHRPTAFRFHGTTGDPDFSFHSHSLAWSANGLYVVVNAWWEPLSFSVREAGEWTVVMESAPSASDGDGRRLSPRSVVVMRRVET